MAHPTACPVSDGLGMPWSFFSRNDVSQGGEAPHFSSTSLLRRNLHIYDWPHGLAVSWRALWAVSWRALWPQDGGGVLPVDFPVGMDLSTSNPNWGTRSQLLFPPKKQDFPFPNLGRIKRRRLRGRGDATRYQGRWGGTCLTFHPLFSVLQPSMASDTVHPETDPGGSPSPSLWHGGKSPSSPCAFPWQARRWDWRTRRRNPTSRTSRERLFWRSP